MSGRTQRINERRYSADCWDKFEVLSTDAAGDIESRAIVQSKIGSTFVDLSIEEYTGITRRAKYASVRLEEDAARRLHAALSALFDGKEVGT